MITTAQSAPQPNRLRGRLLYPPGSAEQLARQHLHFSSEGDNSSDTSEVQISAALDYWSDDEGIMGGDDDDDLQWKNNYNCFEWARNQISEHEDGCFARIRQELTGDGGDDERYIRRRNKHIIKTSKLRLLKQKNAAEAVIAGARVPRVPQNTLDSNAAMDSTAMSNTGGSVAHVVLAIMKAVVSPDDAVNKAVSDIRDVRQGTTPAEEFIQYEFAPMAFVAQLPDPEYAEALVEAANPFIHKKMKSDGYHCIQQQLRAALGEGIRSATPAAANAEFIRLDKSLRITAQKKPYKFDDYLIPESTAAHVPTEEDIVWKKVNAIDEARKTEVSELRERMETMEKRQSETDEKLGAVSKHLEAVETKVEKGFTDVLSGFSAFSATAEKLEKKIDDVSRYGRIDKMLAFFGTLTPDVRKAKAPRESSPIRPPARR